MKKKTFFKGAVLFLILFSLLLGCAKKGLKTIEGDPETLYKQGLTRFNKRDYPEALKSFEQLKSSFPDSPPYTVWAELKVGDCHFFQKEYVEAIAAYEEFKKIHPTHEEVSYVQYQIGMAYYHQILTPDRDQTSTQKALSNFEYLIANYPPSLFTDKTKEKIAFCKKQLAAHEFYIGNYYYKNGKFKAASVRFQGLIERFPKVPHEDVTLFLLGKSFLELDQWEKAEEAFHKIVTEYPQSSYYKEAKSILDQGPNREKVSANKTKKPKQSKIAENEAEKIYLIKFEEEGKRPVSFAPASPSVMSESVKPILPKEEPEKVTYQQNQEPVKEGRALSLSSPPPEVKPISSIPSEANLKIEIKPKEEKQTSALQQIPTPPEERTEKKALLEPTKIEAMEKGQPIDIISDRVETYSKENLIVFKGNVIARQKDIVIYADSLEALIIEGGKGIEKVIAGGNVRLQQGLRVASCQKAVFYNFDQKVILTGDPKVVEGRNMISGDEIIFDIEKNQLEVKGGPGGRGKMKILPGGEVEKLD